MQISDEWIAIDQRPIDTVPAAVLVIDGRTWWRQMYPDETLRMIAQETVQPGMARLAVYRVEALGDWENSIVSGRVELTIEPCKLRGFHE